MTRAYRSGNVSSLAHRPRFVHVEEVNDWCSRLLRGLGHQGSGGAIAVLSAASLVISRAEPAGEHALCRSGGQAVVNTSSKPSDVPRHVPVLKEQVVEMLAAAAGGVVVDCTLGHGGHSEALLESARPPRMLIGIDRDPEAIAVARKRLERFGDSFVAAEAPFSRAPEILTGFGIKRISGVLFDLGMSSGQLESPSRGFSYKTEGPLDMRMSPSAELTASVVVNRYPEQRLASIIRRYGEEPAAYRIAREIVRRRPLSTTTELAAAVEAGVVGFLESRRAWRTSGGTSRRRPSKKDHRTAINDALQRTFQAIRIEVNRELEEFAQALVGLLPFLETRTERSRVAAENGSGGRIVTIAYHSLEDRIAKTFFQESSKQCRCPPELVVCGCSGGVLVEKLVKRAVRPTPAEVSRNPRARSARLRAGERTDCPIAEADIIAIGSALRRIVGGSGAGSKGSE
jgi:16S rRNA (cytosine1402-N4)-methyltransferase